MNMKGRWVDGKVASLQLRKQGPWLILRLHHPDGCRFFDQFAGTITGEDKKAITEDSQRLTSASL